MQKGVYYLLPKLVREAWFKIPGSGWEKVLRLDIIREFISGNGYDEW